MDDKKDKLPPINREGSPTSVADLNKLHRRARSSFAGAPFDPSARPVTPKPAQLTPLIETSSTNKTNIYKERRQAITTNPVQPASLKLPPIPGVKLSSPANLPPLPPTFGLKR